MRLPLRGKEETRKNLSGVDKEWASPSLRRGPTDVGTVLRLLANRRLHGHAAQRESARGVPEGYGPLTRGDARDRAGDEHLRDDVHLSREQPVRELPESDLHPGRRDRVRGPSVNRDRLRRGPGGTRPASGWFLRDLSGIGDRRVATRTDLRGRPGEKGNNDPGRALARGRAEERRAARGRPRCPSEGRRLEGPRPADRGDGNPIAPSPNPVH